MNRDNIYAMAEEAGIRLASQSDPIDHRNVYLHELQRFAALVAAAEREACARIAEEFGDPRDGIDRAIRARSKG